MQYIIYFLKLLNVLIYFNDKASNVDNKAQLPFTPKPLLGFVGNEHKNSPKGIAIYAMYCLFC
jgi:hypothetical protein